MGAWVSYGGRLSSFDALVRNLSSEGARLEFAHIALLPHEVDLEIPQKGIASRATIVWRRQFDLGLAFLAYEAQGVAPVEFARKLRQLEADRAMLIRRVGELNESAI